MSMQTDPVMANLTVRLARFTRSGMEWVLRRYRRAVPASADAAGGGCVPMRSRQTTTRAATAVALIIVAALMAACTSKAPTPLPSPTSSATGTASSTPSPRSSIDPTIAQAEAAILKAYQGYWNAKIAAFADPTKDPGPELRRYAIDKAFSDVATTMFTFRDSGISVTGRPVLSPTVSDVVAGDAGTATIVDCVDGSTWQPIYTATGKSAAVPGQAQRLLTTSTAYFYADHWTIRTSNVDRQAPC